MADGFRDWFFSQTETQWRTIGSVSPENLKLLTWDDFISEDHGVGPGVYVAFRNYIYDYWDCVKEGYRFITGDQLPSNTGQHEICHVGTWPGNYQGRVHGKVRLFRLKLNSGHGQPESCTDTQFGHLPIILGDFVDNDNRFCSIVAIKITQNTSDGSQEYIKITAVCVDLTGGGNKEFIISLLSCPCEAISGCPGGTYGTTINYVGSIYISCLYSWFMHDTSGSPGGVGGFSDISVSSSITINDSNIYSINGSHVNNGSGVYKISNTRYTVATQFFNNTGNQTNMYAYLGIWTGATGILWN